MLTEPDEIVVGKARYLRDKTLRAVSLGDDREPPTHALWVTEAPRLAVLNENDAVDLPAFGPVYRAEPGGTLAVPTGRVFVRFEEGAARDRGDTLRDIGFRVEEVPSFAPDSAWLVPWAGGVVEALRALDGLRSRAGVSHVEPELLRPMAKRSARS